MQRAPSEQGAGAIASGHDAIGRGANVSATALANVGGC